MDVTMEAVERTISQRNEAGTLGCNPVESQGRTTTDAWMVIMVEPNITFKGLLPGVLG